MCRANRKQYKKEFAKTGRRLYKKCNEYPRTYSMRNFYYDSNSCWYEDIDPVFYGYQVKLEILPALKNSNLPGLEEAINFATVKLTFSGDELRRCNLKDNYLFKTDDKYNQYWDENNILKKGILWFRPLSNIDRKEFEKLSEDAKKWFITWEEKLQYSKQKVLHISTNIPRGYCREVKVPLYINQIRVLNSDYIRKAAWYEDLFRDRDFSCRVEHSMGQIQYKWYNDLDYKKTKQIIKESIEEAIEYFVDEK